MRHDALMSEPLPFIDRHEHHIDATGAVAFDALWGVLRRGGTSSATRRYARLVRCVPRELRSIDHPTPGTTTFYGFAVAGLAPGERLVLDGRHAFSRYRLEFEITPAPHGIVLSATTYAVFPGALGALYRAAVIGTRMHVLVTRSLLRSVANRADRTTRQ